MGGKPYRPQTLRHARSQSILAKTKFAPKNSSREIAQPINCPVKDLGFRV